MAKTGYEIEVMKGIVRSVLYESGFVGSDWYEVMWGVLMETYIEDEVGDWKSWKELVVHVKGCMVEEIERWLGV